VLYLPGVFEKGVGQQLKLGKNETTRRKKGGDKRLSLHVFSKQGTRHTEKRLEFLSTFFSQKKKKWD